MIPNDFVRLRASTKMAYLKIKGKKRKYWIRDNDCLSAQCLVLGLYQRRGAGGMGAGSHSTGAVSACCMTNAYRGCPDCPKYSGELAAQRRKEGICLQP
jgi:hypothetical protein